MKESELAFWQKTARHYTRSMDRSAPLYAAVCERIRPHLSRDMNVLELACGTGQLSFPLSPYVRLWEATDAAPAMIQEAKKRIGSSRLHFSVQDAAHLPYAPESFDAVVIANALHILPEPDRVLREIQRDMSDLIMEYFERGLQKTLFQRIPFQYEVRGGPLPCWN